MNPLAPLNIGDRAKTPGRRAGYQCQDCPRRYQLRERLSYHLEHTHGYSADVALAMARYASKVL